MRVLLAAVVVLGGWSAAEAQSDDPPVLNSLTAAHVGGNWWVITGSVTDESPSSCTVEFGGILDGFSTSVASDGSFSYVKNISSGGLVSAVAVDAALQESNERETAVF